MTWSILTAQKWTLKKNKTELYYTDTNDLINLESREPEFISYVLHVILETAQMFTVKVDPVSW
jgi:hypothetical protein